MRRNLEPATLTSATDDLGGLTIKDMQEELDGFYALMRDFENGDASNNLLCLSGFTARMSHIRTHLVRRAGDREIQNFRTKELDPFLSECDRQFKIWSRLISAVQFEYETSGARSR